MNLSISNIAWFSNEDDDIYEIMKANGFTGLDIAPARICSDPQNCTVEQGHEYQKIISKYDLKFIGMQSLLFGTNGFNIFGEAKVVEDTLEYLKEMVNYASKLGIKILVFGSPKNRLIGELDYDDAYQRAIEFFRRIGEYAASHNVIFCIEPNPTEYGADFITNTFDGIQLVKDVSHEGFKLHLDLGTMIMNEESICDVIEKGIEHIAHVHISVPNLMQVCDFEKKIAELAHALHENRYEHYVAIEMRNSITTPNTIAVKDAITLVSRIFQGV